MRSQWVAAGRFPDAEDVRLQRRVAFIGSEVARKMFGNIAPVGQRIRLGGMAFEVVGVQKEKVQLSNYLRPDQASRSSFRTRPRGSCGTPSTPP